MENKSDFSERLKEGIKTQEEIDLEIREYLEKNQKRNPSFGEIVDGYKNFIEAQGEEFLKFAEAYIRCIEIARKNELVGNIQLKARIKDFSSSYVNTNFKMLDDMFGIEIVTATEEEKEMFILFNHLIYRIQNDKIYNKLNGYRAYHFTGDYSPCKDVDEKKIDNIVSAAEAREYKNSKHEVVYEKDKMTKIFPNLFERKLDPQEFRIIVQTLQEMLQEMEKSGLIREALPITEFHFMTFDVEREATRGAASHSNYKKANEKLIKDFFRDGRMFRGINSPWKFETLNGKLELQDFYKTLIENWPFLRKEVLAKRESGQEENDKKNNAKFDRLLGVQFPFLRKYIGLEGKEYPQLLRAEQWGALKSIIIANRINQSEDKPKSISGEFIEQMDGLWPDI